MTSAGSATAIIHIQQKLSNATFVNKIFRQKMIYSYTKNVITPRMFHHAKMPAMKHAGMELKNAGLNILKQVIKKMR